MKFFFPPCFTQSILAPLSSECSADGILFLWMSQEWWKSSSIDTVFSHPPPPPSLRHFVLFIGVVKVSLLSLFCIMLPSEYLEKGAKEEEEEERKHSEVVKVFASLLKEILKQFTPTRIRNYIEWNFTETACICWGGENFTYVIRKSAMMMMPRQGDEVRSRYLLLTIAIRNFLEWYTHTQLSFRLLSE